MSGGAASAQSVDRTLGLAYSLDVQRVVALPLSEVRSVGVPLLGLELDVGGGEFLTHSSLQLGVSVIGAKRVEQIERQLGAMRDGVSVLVHVDVAALTWI